MNSELAQPESIEVALKKLKEETPAPELQTVIETAQKNATKKIALVLEEDRTRKEAKEVEEKGINNTLEAILILTKEMASKAIEASNSPKNARDLFQSMLARTFSPPTNNDEGKSGYFNVTLVSPNDSAIIVGQSELIRAYDTDDMKITFQLWPEGHSSRKTALIQRMYVELKPRPQVQGF